MSEADHAPYLVWSRLNFLQRYLVVMGCILGALLLLTVTSKPKPSRLKRGVETELAAWAKRHDLPLTGRPALPEHKGRAADYLVARSYVATLADGHRFSCIGVFHITFCNSPGGQD